MRHKLLSAFLSMLLVFVLLTATALAAPATVSAGLSNGLSAIAAAGNATTAPTAIPTAKATAKPTTAPTAAPTAVPTAKATAKPTTAPTAEPTAVPTAKATTKPTTVPTAEPTAVPTAKATAKPTTVPTAEPTAITTAIPTVEPTEEPSPLPIPMQEDSQGDEVKAVQKFLRSMGFMTGTADGYFGPITGKGVIAFQNFVAEYMGIELHYVDPDATPAPTAEPTATPEPTALPTAIPTVEPATTVEPVASPEASDAPAALNNMGHGPVLAATAEPTVQPTPEPTPYVADGIVDERMYTMIVNGEFTVYYSDLQKGDEGSDVKRLQTRLSSLYYLVDGVDGIFGGNTQSALTYFQKYNNLEQTGVADEQTQLTLFSEDAVPTVQPTLAPASKDSRGNGKSYSRYKLVIDVSDQRVYAYGYENGAYGPLARVMVCSTGTSSHPTPLGTFSGSGPVDKWHYFVKYDCWARYAWRIKGSILFHSVLFSYEGDETPSSSSVRNLGRRASHGCVRLSVEDAKWIYNNCSSGTTVVVRE